MTSQRPPKLLSLNELVWDNSAQIQLENGSKNTFAVLNIIHEKTRATRTNTVTLLTHVSEHFCFICEVRVTIETILICQGFCLGVVS